MIRPLTAIVLFAALSLGCAERESAVVTISAESGSSSLLSQDEAVVLPTSTCGNFFIVEAMINGKGPFSLLLDTGASRTILSSRAASLARTGSGIQRLQLGSVSIDGHMPCNTRDIDHLGDTLGTPIDGILGHTVFRNVLLIYDYPAQEIRIRRGKLTDDAPGVAPMSTSSRPFLGAMIGDTKTNILLDTGFGGGLALTKFDRQTFLSEPTNIGARARLDGLYLIRAGRLADDVQFGSFSIKQPIVRNAVGTSLLGQDILSAFIVTIDQTSGRVQMVRPDGTAEVEPITSLPIFGAGWAIVAEPDHLKVRHVFAESAAEHGGIQVGDSIVSIDGVPIADRGCTGQEEKNSESAVVKVEVERDGARLEFEFETAVLVE